MKITANGRILGLNNIIALVLCSLAYLAATPAAAQISLQDSFSDDTPNSMPNGPEVGDATYGTGLLVGVHIGQYAVTEAGGEKLLLISTNGIPGGQDNGTLIEYNPLPMTGQALTVKYDFGVSPGGNQVAVNSWMQEIILAPLGTNLGLYWSSDQKLYMGQTAPGQSSFSVRDLAFSYQVGQLYSIEWQVNIDTDQFGLTIDGTQVASAVSLGTDAVSFRQLISQTTLIHREAH
jgi:hypothetical protein